MSSEQEDQQQPGPSGVSREEVLTLLGLNTSDSEEEEENEPTLLCHETLDESEDEEDRYCRLALEELERQYEAEDQWCNQALDDYERQRSFQTQLLQQSGGGLDPKPSVGTFEFDLEPLMERTSAHLGARERIVNTRLRQTGNFIDTPHVAQALRDALQRAMTRVLYQIPDLHEDDRLFFTISSNRLSRGDFHGWGVRVGEWQRGDGDRVEAVLDRLSRALNSNEQFEMDDSFQLRITHVQRPPQGTGSKRRLKPGHQTLALLKPKKRSIVQIKNDDVLCCARALVTAKAKVDQHPQWESFKKGRNVQKEQALLLHHDAKVPVGPCGYEELTQFSLAPSLFDYQILLVDADRAFHITGFGPHIPDKQLILLHEKGHYDVITTLKGFLGKSYVCAHCFKGYENATQHRCQIQLKCSCCLQPNCSDFHQAHPRGQKATQRCHECGRDFFGDLCFQAHQSKTLEGKTAENHQHSICFNKRRCTGCLKMETGFPQIKRHRCGYLTCPSCKEYVNAQTHKCFIQKAPSPQEEKEQKKERKRKQQQRQKRGPPAKRGAAAGLQTLRTNEGGDDECSDDDEDPPPLHMFFDIEAMQLQEQHVANLLVAETEDDSRPVRFRGEHCVRDFLQWLDTLTQEDTRPVNVLAHNFQGYDGYFVANQYHADNQTIRQIRNGCKLLEVRHDKIRFIDSLSFFQMPLAAFPKTFGLTELKKGYFPHKFNLPEHQEYVGPIPAIDHYMPETMSPEGRQKFEAWHKEQSDNQVVFDFQQELVAYCESDVRLLKEGCLTFKRVFEAQTGFNPFEHMTIASACNRDLRMNRMIPNSLASEPVGGWRNNVNQSQVALEWLTWCDHQLRQQAQTHLTLNQSLPITRSHIQHVRNAGEFHVPGTTFTVDGLHPETRTVYEFHGCFWHGCPTCYPKRQEKHLRLLDRTVQDVYEKTQTKMTLLRQKGYQVVEMWECAWSKLLQTHPDVQAYVDSLRLAPPLNPRDAFCGGRTNAIKLHHRVTPDQKIHYIDYTSLYPWVNKTCVYPKGHPIFISQPGHTDISRYFGIVQRQVLPPRELYHPVLPHRHEGKLSFPLCATCVEEEMAKAPLERSYHCAHSEDQRVLTGTWCTPELNKAIELGYQIQHIHEVWHFLETQEGLFKDYVNTWLKIKQEASGWPEWVGDDETKRHQYIHDYFQNEGILLEYFKIQRNPGLRALAKMMLNSMWGKFGQRLNKTQVKDFEDPQAFHSFLDSDANDVKHVSVVNDNIVEVHYQLQEEDIPVSPNLNIFVACFTTCWARLRLYEALERLGQRVLYFDTDSVIYLEEPGQPNPPLGDYLGQFTSELDADDYITEFVSGGPKNYGYQTKKGKVECKVRGFRLNSEGKTQLNYDVMRKNVLDEIQHPQNQPRQTQVVKTHQIVRDAKTYELFTFPDYKCYQLVYDKRVIDPATFQTYPYGYQARCPTTT